MARNQPDRRARTTPLDPGELSVFLASCSPGTAKIVRALRTMARRCVPTASEAIRFQSICFFTPGARFGSIGGNICMIEARAERVRLSFIQGAGLADPAGLLRGVGKAKRFVEVSSVADAKRPTLAAIVRASARRAKDAAGA